MTYYFVLASRKFLCEDEPLGESLKERARNYQERKKEIDFWLVHEPAFLAAPEMSAIAQKCPRPAAAVISTDPHVVRWLKLRLEFVITGEFEAPSATIPDPLASLAVSNSI
jgi:hypothetical protein